MKEPKTARDVLGIVVTALNEGVDGGRVMDWLRENSEIWNTEAGRTLTGSEMLEIATEEFDL